MASTFGEVAKQMRDLAAKLPERANQLKRDVAKTLNFDLLQTTPVDTGQAVSNWQVTLDSPAPEPRPAFAPSPEGRMKDGAWVHRVDPEVTRQANVGPAIEAANEVIDSSNAGQTIYVSNSLPYIQALDDGHSAQAQLFVDRAIILATDRATRANLL